MVGGGKPLSIDATAQIGERFEELILVVVSIAERARIERQDCDVTIAQRAKPTAERLGRRRDAPRLRLLGLLLRAGFELLAELARAETDAHSATRRTLPRLSIFVASLRARARGVT